MNRLIKNDDDDDDDDDEDDNNNINNNYDNNNNNNNNNNNEIDNKRMKWSGKTIKAISSAFAKCDAFYPRIIFRNWHVKHLSFNFTGWHNVLKLIDRKDVCSHQSELKSTSANLLLRKIHDNDFTNDLKQQ